MAGGCRAHQLRRHRLVAAADQHHRIHRLGTDHLFGIHRHQIAQIHAGRRGEALVNRDGRKIHRQAAGQHHPAFHRFDELRRVAVAGIVGATRVGDADRRPIERGIGVAGALDERLAQEQREAPVAVAGQAFFQAALIASGCFLGWALGVVFGGHDPEGGFMYGDATVYGHSGYWRGRKQTRRVPVLVAACCCLLPPATTQAGCAAAHAATLRSR